MTNIINSIKNTLSSSFSWFQSKIAGLYTYFLDMSSSFLWYVGLYPSYKMNQLIKFLEQGETTKSIELLQKDIPEETIKERFSDIVTLIIKHIKTSELSQILNVPVIKRNFDNNRQIAFNFLIELMSHHDTDKNPRLLDCEFLFNAAYFDGEKALLYACSNGRENFLTKLLECTTIRNRLSDNAIETIFKNANHNIIKIILNKADNMIRVSSYVNKQFDEMMKLVNDAIRDNKSEKISELLKNPILQSRPKKLITKVLNNVNNFPNAQVFKAVFDAPFIQSYLENNPNEILNLLKSTEAIIDDYMEILLGYNFINNIIPSLHTNDNEIFLKAAKFGRIKTVTSLLKFPNIVENLHNNNNKILIETIESKHINIATKLLEYKNVLDSAHLQNNVFLRFICHYEWFNNQEVANHIFRKILENPNVASNLHATRNFALRWSCRHGNEDIVRILLEDPNVVANADAENNQAYVWAAANRHYNILELLQNRCPKVVIYLNNNESSMRAFNVAEKNDLNNIIAPYKNLSSEQVSNVIKGLIRYLEDEYKNEPATLKDGTQLPLAWEDFQNRSILWSKSTYKEALIAYHHNQPHTKWRLFLEKNQWMSPDADFIIINPDGTKRADFKGHITLIAKLWLAICKLNNHNFKQNFTIVFFDINRGYNQEKNLPDAGDMPSCTAGMEKRLYQAAQMTFNSQILNEQIIDQTINNFIFNYYNILYHKMDLSEQNHVIDLIEAETVTERSEEVAENFIKDINEEKVPNTLTYFKEIFKSSNLKTQACITDLVYKDNNLKKAYGDFLDYSREEYIEKTKYNNDSIHNKTLDSYNIAKDEINEFINKFANEYPGINRKASIFTDKYRKYMEDKFATKNDSHIISFYFQANLDSIFFPDDRNIIDRHLAASASSNSISETMIKAVKPYKECLIM